MAHGAPCAQKRLQRGVGGVAGRGGGGVGGASRKCMCHKQHCPGLFSALLQFNLQASGVTVPLKVAQPGFKWL